MASSNVITGTDYLAIATYYASARSNNLGSVTYLYDAVYKIVLSDSVYPTIDLVNEFWTSYLINTDIYRSPTTYLSAVRAINNHVINRAGNDGNGDPITDINDYLADQNITVPLGWADLCKVTGVLICRNYITGNPTTFTDGTSTPANC
jgi:hypothetical protein